MNQKKRHHYVPKAYLKAFCDASGNVHVYLKDNAKRPFCTDLDNIGVERYYYSQPMPDGGVDNNRLEEIFSTVEDKWPVVIDRLNRRENVNDALELIFEFMALQRVRVPASRDVTEMQLAASVKQTLLTMRAAGELPPPPVGLEDLLDRIVVSIDPHMSIHGMVGNVFGSVARVFERIGLLVVRNTTNRPFLTSDNPVIWFDPSVPDDAQRPYNVSDDGPAMLLFPMSPTLLLMGSTEARDDFARYGLLESVTPTDAWVVRVNETVCRYGYKAVYAQCAGQEDIIVRHAMHSPVHDSSESHARMTFGPRAEKPKWKVSDRRTTASPDKASDLSG